MNPLLQQLHSYPFEKLNTLLTPLSTPTQRGARSENGGEPYSPLNISVGEPKHPVATIIRQAMANALDDIGTYPSTKGMPALRQTMARWAERRFQLGDGSLDPEQQVLPVNGTREALFSIAQAVINPLLGMESSWTVKDQHQTDGQHQPPTYTLLPNPFYQIYEGATLMAGAQPILVESTAANGFLPDYHQLPKAILQRTALLYLCTPANPTGAVFPLERLKQLIELAHTYDFIIASDECYSEIWYNQPPPGLLQAAKQMGIDDYRRCLAFHSLSKRSNMPGARSGFVAGDATILKHYFRLRTYTGCATPHFIQKAAIQAWSDEKHVQENRQAYQNKLADAMRILRPILPVTHPDAGFYLWLQVPGGGESFAQHLYQDYNVTVLPGAYLGRPDKTTGKNPGNDYIRVALVAPFDENRQAMQRIAACANTLIKP